MKRAVIITIFICHLSLAMGHSAFAVNGLASDPSRNLFTARQLGLGGVTVNWSDDGSGVFANPAGLTNFDFPQITTASRKLLLDETQHIFAGLAVPTAFGTFGLGYTGLSIGGSLPTSLDPGTGRITQNPSLEAGSYSSSVLAISYSRKVTAPVKLSVGGNLKFFHQALSGSGSDQGTGMGIDLGLTYQPLRWLETGVSLSNLTGGGIKWSSVEDRLGSAYRLGAKATLFGPSSEALNIYPQRLDAGVDLELGPTLFHLGLEYSPLKNISLRAGINQESAGAGLTFGLGLVNSGFRFDYAYVQRAGLPGDTPHYFSLSYIGERVMTVSSKLTVKQSRLNFLAPRNRLITDQETISVSVEAFAFRVLDQKRTWTVTALSETRDAQAITTAEPFAKLTLNGQALTKLGNFEEKAALTVGRNIIQLIGFTSPEALSPQQVVQAVAGSAELTVLRIQPFNDTPLSFWAIEPISLTVVLGLVNGYPDNSFKPEKGITRAELITLLVKSLGVPQDVLDSYGSAESFSDVQLNNWAAKFIAYGSTMKLVSGYPDGTFSSNKVLNRAEGIAILARYASLPAAAGLPEETASPTPPFPDLKSDFWANKFIEPARKAGLLNYLAGKEFNAAAPFTRAEACEVLYRVPNIKKMVEEYWESGIVSSGR